MPRQSDTVTDHDRNRQSLRNKTEHINTIFDILLDISCKLFEILEINDEAEIPVDYERVLTVYRNEVNAQGDDSFCKVIFRGTPSLDKVISGSISVTPVLKKEYKNTCVGTDTIKEGRMCRNRDTTEER